MKPPLIALRWYDAHATTTADYEIHAIPHHAIEITTYGLLLREDELGVSIACEEAGAGCYRGVTFVPKAMVIEVKYIKPARRKREPAALPGA